MKTQNFDLELMVHNQQNKEVFFNETIGVIDSFILQSVVGFVSSPPTESPKNLKFIINEGEYENHICFCNFENKPWKYMEPKLGMVLYCIEMRSFIYFDGTSWSHAN